MSNLITYDEIQLLESTIEFKRKAEEIYDNYLKNWRLKMSKFKDGKFILWSDSNNATYIEYVDNIPYYRLRYLHQSYDIELTLNGIFTALKSGYKGGDYLYLDSQRSFD